MKMTHNAPVVEVKPPSAQTLRKYGLSVDDWIAIWDAQGRVCPICGKTSTRMAIDHEHFPKFKKLPADVKRFFIRGILCWQDNYYRVGKGATILKLENAVKYLRNYEEKRKHEYTKCKSL
jgi:hypothetical protein